MLISKLFVGTLILGTSLTINAENYSLNPEKYSTELLSSGRNSEKALTSLNQVLETGISNGKLNYKEIKKASELIHEAESKYRVFHSMSASLGDHNSPVIWERRKYCEFNLSDKKIYNLSITPPICNSSSDSVVDVRDLIINKNIQDNVLFPSDNLFRLNKLLKKKGLHSSAEGLIMSTAYKNMRDEVLYAAKNDQIIDINPSRNIPFWGDGENIHEYMIINKGADFIEFFTAILGLLTIGILGYRYGVPVAKNCYEDKKKVTKSILPQLQVSDVWDDKE